MNAQQQGAGQGRGALQWLWLSVAIVAADQLTKWLVTHNLALYERIELLPVLGLTHLHNTGAAFSFLADAGGWQRWFFIAIALLVTVMVCFWLYRMPARGEGWLAAALALVVGGAVGNVIDRVLHGYVIDFISVHWERSFFPAFNVADSAITVGAAILIIDSFYESRRKQKVI
jgi:signal peptidase II